MTEQLGITTVEEAAHTRVRDCYQCGKCSAGCPVAARMDILPNQLLRLVQLDRVEKALRSAAIWECVSCMTCTTRCPKSVDCAGVLDALRQRAVERGVAAPAQRRTILFQQAFLDNIRRNGRLAELELVGQFKGKVFFGDLNVPALLKDALLAPRMFARGKLHLRSEKVKDRPLVARIFARCLDRTPRDSGGKEPFETVEIRRQECQTSVPCALADGKNGKRDHA
jgi:heterodisulfide reductase subunit C